MLMAQESHRGATRHPDTRRGPAAPAADRNCFEKHQIQKGTHGHIHPNCASAISRQ
jgi:hypothetical protein